MSLELLQLLLGEDIGTSGGIGGVVAGEAVMPIEEGDCWTNAVDRGEASEISGAGAV